MSKRRERTFEDEVVAHLTAHGWLEGQSAGYDRELALYVVYSGYSRCVL